VRDACSPAGRYRGRIPTDGRPPDAESGSADLILAGDVHPQLGQPVDEPALVIGGGASSWPARRRSVEYGRVEELLVRLGGASDRSEPSGPRLLMITGIPASTRCLRPTTTQVTGVPVLMISRNLHHDNSDNGRRQQL
jgi:hypothetical protein